MQWKQFEDKMPEGDCRLLICGHLNTDPLTPPEYDYTYLEFVDYKDGLLIPDDDGHEWYAPDPEDYWIYQKSILTPFDDKKEPNYKALIACDRCYEYLYFEGSACCEEDKIESCVCPKCLKKED